MTSRAQVDPFRCNDVSPKPPLEPTPSIMLNDPFLRVSILDDGCRLIRVAANHLFSECGLTLDNHHIGGSSSIFRNSRDDSCSAVFN